jgi:hypothetical protein
VVVAMLAHCVASLCLRCGKGTVCSARLHLRLLLLLHLHLRLQLQLHLGLHLGLQLQLQLRLRLRWSLTSMMVPLVSTPSCV